MGIGDVVEFANPVTLQRPSLGESGSRRSPAESSPRAAAFASLATISADSWRTLSERAIDPNGYYLPEWELAVDASARGRTDVSALSAWSLPEAGMARMIGLMPVISCWRAYKLPLPALVSADPYGTLGTPLLDRDAATEAVTQMMQQARAAGAHALILRDVALDGAAAKTIADVLAHNGKRPRLLQSHARACLDATRDADELLRDALGAKKLKELRRQRNRLAEHGEVRFEVARTSNEVAAALESFLKLEASGWKGKRGTALMQDDGDAAFIRRATAALAAKAQCEIVTLRAGDTPVASAIVLRHLDRAFYFKLGVDETYARLSPGVQLTLDLTRHLCADPSIASVDSTANAGHPMIDPIWRGRLAIGDLLIPLSRRDPMVEIIHAAMKLRLNIREPARRAVHFIRKSQERFS